MAKSSQQIYKVTVDLV
ncbi:unnamed protein product [Clonostachys solani]|uniref:Uncharacterized protein n=1 Tax=Clonostachys solani TaxID=160281 RepID=A0A9N9ZKB6_9HYPO|nr:unnamed protein product [Clonostachys solani]